MEVCGNMQKLPASDVTCTLSIGRKFVVDITVHCILYQGGWLDAPLTVQSFSHKGYNTVASNPGFPFRILSRSFGIFLQSCETESGTESLGSRLTIPLLSLCLQVLLGHCRVCWGTEMQ